MPDGTERLDTLLAEVEVSRLRDAAVARLLRGAEQVAVDDEGVLLTVAVSHDDMALLAAQLP